MTHPLIANQDRLAACQQERDAAQAELARIRRELGTYATGLDDAGHEHNESIGSIGTAYVIIARELRAILDPD